MSVYSNTQLKSDLGLLTAAYRKNDLIRSKMLSMEIDQKIDRIYTKAQFGFDCEKVMRDICMGEFSKSGEKIAEIGAKYREIYLARAMKHLNEKYNKGQYRYTVEDYHNPRYRPDLSKAPFVGFQPSAEELESWTLKNLAWLDLREDFQFAKDHPVESVAAGLFSLYAPNLTVVGGLAYGGYRAYQVLGDNKSN